MYQFKNRFVGSAAFATASALLVAVAMPANASDVPQPAANASDAAPALEQTVARPADKKYCIIDTMTGSNMQRKVCKTIKQWHDQGVDIEAR